MTLQQLAYVLAAVRCGSLSAAAESLHVAQPSLSEQIRRLERELGVTLFVRTNRRLLLTEAGEQFLPHALRTLDAAREAADSVRAVRTLTGGTVTLGAFSTAEHLLLPDVVAEFRSRHPGVAVRVLVRNSTEVADAVRDGDLEAGIVALPVDDRALTVSPVVWTSEVVYCSAEPLRTRRRPTVADLAAADLVLPESHSGQEDPTRRQLAERAQLAGVALAPVVEVGSAQAALALAAEGAGDTVVALPLVHRLGYDDRLSWTPLDPPLVETFAFVTRGRAEPTPAMRVLMQLVAAHLQRVPHSRVPRPGG